MNEHEDTFIEVVTQKESNAKAKICTEVADYCGEFAESVDQTDDEEDDEEAAGKQAYDKTEL